MRRFLFSLFLTASLLHASEARDLQKTTRKWQDKLEMQDWSITTKPVPIEVLQGLCPSSCAAISTWDRVTRTGTVFVLMRSDYTPAMRKALNIKNVKADQRDSVVHELIHNVIGHMRTESAVVTITKALKP